MPRWATTLVVGRCAAAGVVARSAIRVVDRRLGYHFCFVGGWVAVGVVGQSAIWVVDARLGYHCWAGQLRRVASHVRAWVPLNRWCCRAAGAAVPGSPA